MFSFLLPLKGSVCSCLCYAFSSLPSFLFAEICSLLLARYLIVGGFGMSLSQSFERQRSVSPSLPSREVLSLLSTFLENSLVMQMSRVVKQYEEKSVLLAF